MFKIFRGVLFIFVLAAPVLVSACTEAANQLTAPAESVWSTGAEGDSISWQNNTLEVQDESGNDLRLVRDAEIPSWVQVYENGVYLGLVRFSYTNGEISEYRFEPNSSSSWFEANETGTITDADAGPRAGVCTGTDPICIEGGTEAASITPMGGGGNDCSAQYDEMQSAAWDTVGTMAIGAIATKASGGLLAPVAVGAAIGSTGRALGKAIKWGMCMLT